MFIESKFFFCDFSSFAHSIIFANLFKSKKVWTGVHNTTGNYNRWNINSTYSHKV